MEIGGVIRRLREERGVSREQLAQTLGLSYWAMAKYESAERTPGPVILAKIAAYFEVSVDFLLGRDVDKQQTAPGDTRAIFRASQNLTPEERRSVLDFIEYMRSKRGGGTDSQAAPERGPGP